MDDLRCLLEEKLVDQLRARLQESGCTCVPDITFSPWTIEQGRGKTCVSHHHHPPCPMGAITVNFTWA